MRMKRIRLCGALGVVWLVVSAAGRAQAPATSSSSTAPPPGGVNSRSAEAALQQRLSRNPNDAVAARSLADLLERSGRTRAALTVRRTLLDQARDPETIAQAKFELGTALVEAGQSQEAIPLLQAVVTRHPADEPAVFELGTALAHQQEYVAAVAAFENAARLQPGDTEAQLSAAKVLVTLLRYAEAEPYLDAAAHAGRQDFETATLRGLIDSHTDRRPQATQAFAEAVRQKPDDAEAQLRLGEALRAEGRPLDAIAPLKRSAELQPSVSAFFQLSKSYREQGRTAEAQQAAESLKALEDQRAIATKVAALVSEAQAEAAAGNGTQASETYQAALRLRPGDAELLYRLALLRGQMHQPASEEQLLRQALAQSPLLVGALAQLGTLEASEGKTVEAKQHLSQALRLDPQQSDALSGLGVLAAREGDLPSAERLLRDAVESDPASAERRRNLGLVYAAAGHFSEAEGALVQSSLMAPGVVQTQLALGQIYITERKYPLAVEPLQAATTLAPREAEGFLALAQALYFTGKTDQALEAERRGLALLPRAEAVERQAQLCGRLIGSPVAEHGRSACETALTPSPTATSLPR